jgi:adenine-specific DNA-methyltransferase
MARTPRAPSSKSKTPKRLEVESHTHAEARRRHIPTAEQEPLVQPDEAAPEPVAVRPPRATPDHIAARDGDLDPQLVWRGKPGQDAEGLTVGAVPIYIQEKIHPKALIADLRRRSDSARRERDAQQAGHIPDLFADFNGLPEPDAEIEFYEHDRKWQNRMILGDSLLVMASLAQKEALRGQVQCIYFDPPYGIRFNSNWQPSTRSRDVQDGKPAHLTREPEMIRAFRDTWKDGIHSYLSYLRERLILARELLSESGSLFVQIGDENVHLVRALMDEVFGRQNYVANIAFAKTSGSTKANIAGTFDFVIFYAKDIGRLKSRPLFSSKEFGGAGASGYNFVQTDVGVRRRVGSRDPLPADSRLLTIDNLTSQSAGREKGEGAASWFKVNHRGKDFDPTQKARWKTNSQGMGRLAKADRLEAAGNTLRYVRYLDDFPYYPISDFWADTTIAGFAADKTYVVQTANRIVERCLLMATDPGDLVLDPTCGSGTTATVAEQWGRRWITIDTSRVALALARQRLMAARFPGYLLQDSPEGARKEAELSGRPPAEGPFTRSVRAGFVYERVPHIRLRDIANNAAIDVIWEAHQATLDPLRARLNEALGTEWEEWQVPRDPADDWPDDVRTLHADWWAGRRARQAEIDAAIAQGADTEFLYDRPYEDKGKVRVTGPFTVESLSPHRILAPDEDDDEMLALLAADAAAEGRELPPRTRAAPRSESATRAEDDFARVVLDNLLKAGVQNTRKGERLMFTDLRPWPGGRFVQLEGHYQEGEQDRRVAVFIGPEYGTVSRGMVRRAAAEALNFAFDTLVVCGFAFEAQVNEDELGRFPGLTVLKARMNADLHMADSLRAAGANNLFVVFGEPDIVVRADGGDRHVVEIRGVDIFDPTTGQVRSNAVDDIACWFIDTDYDGTSFFVRHAYFLGGNDPYRKLKTTLKAEIDEDAWATLYGSVSRPFEAPSTGRIAVKVINHYGDEVMKVYDVDAP